MLVGPSALLGSGFLVSVRFHDHGLDPGYVHAHAARHLVSTKAESP
jgi:hypothetical protein